MIVIAFAEDAMQLLGDMLAHEPSATTIPQDCSIALRPIEPADVDRCTVMDGEFSIFANHVRRLVASSEGKTWHRAAIGQAMYWLLVNREQTIADEAARVAPYCAAPAVEQMLADMTPQIEGPPVWTLGCVNNIVGCEFSSLMPTAFDPYDRRVLDFAAHLRLTATLLWLRNDTPGTTSSERFAHRPQALRSPGHESAIDESRAELRVENMFTTRAARFVLPLPAKEI